MISSVAYATDLVQPFVDFAGRRDRVAEERVLELL
jgi:hypothetical protein